MERWKQMSMELLKKLIEIGFKPLVQSVEPARGKENPNAGGWQKEKRVENGTN